MNREEGKVPVSATVIFYILGLCTMLPWNFFITADSYWQYKLRNITAGDSWDDPDSTLTDLQVSFTPALVIISNISCFIFSFVTSGITRWIGERERIIGSLVLSLIAMLVISSFTFVNTDQWQDVFYGLTLTVVALLNIGIAILQASLYGTVGLFPAKCIASLYSGQSLAGVFSSLAQITSLAIGDADPVVSGIIYFAIADVFIVISIAAYCYFLKTNFYKEAKSGDDEISETKNSTTLKEYFRILKKTGWMGFTLGLALLITLSVFPAVQVYVSSTHTGTAWGDIYFQPTITFLVFNVMDMVGREISIWIQWPGHKGWLFHVVASSRIVFIPLMLLCHGDNKTFPTLFHEDIYYIIFNSLFGLTNGYFSALAMVYYPRFVTKDETEIAGAMMATLMGVGMVVGSVLSPVFVKIWGPNYST